MGDGTEVHADQEEEEELFDPADEGKDDKSQVRNSSTESTTNDAIRKHREGTPGPQLTYQNNAQNIKDTSPPTPQVSASPSSITTESSSGKENEDGKAGEKPSES